MKSNAPGQLLGYVLQLPRALCHLLRGGPGDIVCVELLGDVATRDVSGETIVEEDKSSTSGNPLTDKSSNLWKTFSNWVDAVNEKTLNVSKTKFVLYCNHPVRGGIVTKFSDATTQQEVQSAIDYAKATLSDIKKGHEIWEYYNSVINQNEALLREIVLNFELQLGSAVSCDEVRGEIRRKQVSDTQIEFILKSLNGWLLEVITTKIAARELPAIKWEDYDHCFLTLFERLRTRELIDFTLQDPPKQDAVQAQVRKRPKYVEQLDKVNISDDDIVEAVIDYLKADVNRAKWIDDETIDESVAADFEARLIAFWKNQMQELKITQKNSTEEERGQLLLARCKSRSETIRDMTPPASTIPGTYHALADKPVLGWHPDWEDLFVNKKEV